MMKTRRDHRHSTEDLGNWKKQKNRTKRGLGEEKKSAKFWRSEVGESYPFYDRSVQAM